MTSILAAVHLHWGFTVGPSVIVGVWILWYWKRLAELDFPDSRRRIRRSSLLVMLVTLPFFVQGMSFVDPARRSDQYILTWLLVMFCTGLVLMTALPDLLNTMRLARRARTRRATEAVSSLADSIRDQDAES